MAIQRQKSSRADSAPKTSASSGASILSRVSRRGAALSALVAAMGVAAVPTMTGCGTLPIVARAVLGVCPEILSRVLNEPIATLPVDYAPCGRQVWRTSGREITFCFFCSPASQAPVYVQLNCTGPYYPVQPRTPQVAPVDPSMPVDEGVQIQKINCHEYLLAIAQAVCDENLAHADATLILPNARSLPSTAEYPTLTVLADGVPTDPSDGHRFDIGASIRVIGDFDEVARYAAESGVRSLEFRTDGNAWRVEVNPEFAAVAIFKNARFIEARFLFSPQS